MIGTPFALRYSGALQIAMAVVADGKRVVMTGLQIAATVVPVPQASVVLNVISTILKQCSDVKVHKVYAAPRSSSGSSAQAVLNM